MEKHQIFITDVLVQFEAFWATDHRWASHFTFRRAMFQCNRKKTSTISTIKMVQPFDNRTEIVEEEVHSEGKADFVYSFKPIYYFSRVCGLMPFSIIYDSSHKIHKIKVCAFDVLWFVISIYLYLYVAFISYKEMTYPKSRNMPKNIMILGDSFILIFVLLFGAMNIIIDMCNRVKLSEILRMFTAFDEEVIFSHFVSYVAFWI